MSFQIDNPGTGELRKFGLIMGGMVAGIFGVLLPWLVGYSWPYWPWIVLAVFWPWALAVPDSLFPVYKLWMRFGHVAGWINTRIILAIMFFGMFFPAGLLMRLLGKDPMRRKTDKNAMSYRIESTPIERNHIERPY